MLFYFLFHIAIALCYIIAIVCLLLHDSVGISTTRTVTLEYILLQYHKVLCIVYVTVWYFLRLDPDQIHILKLYLFEFLPMTII